MRRGGRGTGAACGRHAPELAAGTARRSFPARRTRDCARTRAVVLLLRDPPPRHRDRSADPVRRPDPRRALGALRLPRTRAPTYLGRARGLACRPHADRRDLARRPPERGRRRGLHRRRDHLRRLRADRRTRRSAARPDLALGLGLPLRDAFWTSRRRGGTSRGAASTTTSRCSEISPRATCRSGS